MAAITPKQFDFLADKRGGRATQAARRVLIDGLSQKDAATEFEIKVQTVGHQCKQILTAHAKALEAYCDCDCEKK